MNTHKSNYLVQLHLSLLTLSSRILQQLHFLPNLLQSTLQLLHFLLPLLLFLLQLHNLSLKLRILVVCGGRRFEKKRFVLVCRFFQLSLEVLNVFRVTGRSGDKAGIGGCKLFVGNTKSLSMSLVDIPK